MAKPPVESHRFRIHCEAVEEKLGRILAQLTILGVENVGYELITDVKVFGTRPKRDPTQPSALDFAAEWIKKNPTFRVMELGRYFREQGRPQGTANYVVRSLAEKGRLRQLADGMYQSTEIKHIAGPKKKAGKAAKPPAKAAKTSDVPKKRTRPANPVARFEVTNWDLLRRTIKGRKRVTLKEIEKVFGAEKRNPHSASPLLWRMAKEKYIKQLAPGEYEVLPERARDKRQSQEPAAPVIMAATTTEEAANG
jgi:hypothetical protein